MPSRTPAACASPRFRSTLRPCSARCAPRPTRRLGLKNDARAHLFDGPRCRALGALPSPLWGGVGGGGGAIVSQLARSLLHRITPLPTPPPHAPTAPTDFPPPPPPP